MASLLTVKNLNLSSQDFDNFYHLGLSTSTHNIEQLFSDVKMVCLGGSSRRMKALALSLAAELNLRLPAGEEGLVNLCNRTDRYVMYKFGPILTVNHGIGIPSLSIVLHELAKLLHKANCSTETVFIRLGTCGGLGLEPGTVCISEACCDTLLRPYLEQHIVGQRVERPALLDAELVQQLLAAARCLQADSNGPAVASGITMCANDFYEEQARMDGAVCEFNETQRNEFLRNASSKGVRNIEMESLGFAAMTHKLGLKAACLTLVVVNRFAGDQVQHSRQQIAEWELGMTKILVKFINQQLLNK